MGTTMIGTTMIFAEETEVKGEVMHLSQPA